MVLSLTRDTSSSEFDLTLNSSRLSSVWTRVKTVLCPVSLNLNQLPQTKGFSWSSAE